jgi:hypothetical protein
VGIVANAARSIEAKAISRTSELPASLDRAGSTIQISECELQWTGGKQLNIAPSFLSWKCHMYEVSTACIRDAITIILAAKPYFEEDKYGQYISI